MIVAFTGLAGSGKSSAAQYLVDRHRFVRVRFADTLKTMLRAMGLGTLEIEGDLKEKPCALLMGKTPRWAMQTLGTEWGRNCIHPDIWVTLWQRTALDVIDHGGKVVVDDLRFENELRMLRSMSAMVLRTVRAGAGTDSAHVSENGHLSVDSEVDNNGTIDELRRTLDGLIGSRLAA